MTGLGRSIAPGPLADRLGRIEDLEDALEVDHRGHQVDASVGQRRERHVHPCHQRRQGHEGAGGDGPSDDEVTSDAVDRHGTDGGDEAEGDEEDPPVQRLADAGVADAAGVTLERRELVAVVAEELDEDGTGDVEALRHLCAHRRVVLHLLAGDVLQVAADSTGRHDEQREDAERQQRETPLQHEHRRQGRDESDDVADDVAERGGDGRLGADDVVAEARGDRPGGGAREEGDRHPQHLGEQRRAQVVDERLADGGAAPPLHDVEPGVGDRGDDAEDGERRDQPSVIVGDRRIDDRADDERGHQGEQGGSEDRHDVDGEETAIRAGERPDAPQRRPRQAHSLDGRGVPRHQPGGTEAHELQATGVDGASPGRTASVTGCP